MHTRIVHAYTAIIVCCFFLSGGFSVHLFAQSQLDPPVFSETPGYVDEDAVLMLFHNEDVDIRYTLDGSEPDAQSPLYTGGIGFEMKHDGQLRFIRTTPYEADERGFGWKHPGNGVPLALVIRAKAFPGGTSGEGYQPSKTVTATYLNGQNRHSFPVISINTDKEHFFSDSGGIYVPGDIYKEHGWNHNDAWGRPYGNYHQRGVEWERPGSFELIEQNGTVHQQNIGLRIHGGGSRVQPQKSLRLYSRSSYGESRFNYDMFRDGETGYNRLILRNSGQDFFNKSTMFIDALSQSLVSDLAFDTQKFRPFAVYINGEYWGIKNLRERYDRHYIERNYGIEEGELDLLANMPDYSVGEVTEGSNVFFNSLLDQLEASHVDELGGMAFIEKHVDLENFAAIHAANVYFANIDWPGNNNNYWRYNGEPEGRGSPKDGRFRWMMFDLDFGFSYMSSTGYSSNLFDHYLAPNQTAWANHPRSTLMFRRFMQNREFRDYFINIQLDLLNSNLKEERVVAEIYRFRQMYQHEIERHMERWGYPASKNNWFQHIDERIEFAQQRPGHVRQQLMGRFNAGNPITITIHNEHETRGSVKVNSLVLNEDSPGVEGSAYPWNGIYLSNIPITVRALPKPGYRFVNWQVNGETIPRQEITMNPKPLLTLRANFAEITDPSDGDAELLYNWYFDTTIPNNTALDQLEANYSTTGFTAVLHYRPAVAPYPPADPDDTDGILDRVNDPTPVNYHSHANFGLDYNEDEMRGIRARNPSVTDEGESAIIFDIPTVEFEDIVFSFAARRTASGQETMVFHYSTSSGEPEWHQDGLATGYISTGMEYTLYTVDFSGIAGHAHNPDFKLKISFEGKNIFGNSGNTRFNNIAVFGRPYTGPRVEDIEESRLEPNYPNPFREQTRIPYQVLLPSRVTLDVFTANGRFVARLKREDKAPGFYSAEFSGTGLASGVYIVRLQAGDQADYRRMLLIR